VGAHQTFGNNQRQSADENIGSLLGRAEYRLSVRNHLGNIFEDSKELLGCGLQLFRTRIWLMLFNRIPDDELQYRVGFCFIFYWPASHDSLVSILSSEFVPSSRGPDRILGSNIHHWSDGH
jgi:hypothetical protein